MTGFAKAMRWVARIAGLLALALGVSIWSGAQYSYLRPHIWLGFAVAIALLLLAIGALVRRVRIPLGIVGILWAAALPGIGFGQLQMMPGSNHDIIRVIHLLIGLGGIGFCEALSGALLRSK